LLFLGGKVEKELSGIITMLYGVALLFIPVTGINLPPILIASLVLLAGWLINNAWIQLKQEKSERSNVFPDIPEA